MEEENKEQENTQSPSSDVTEETQTEQPKTKIHLGKNIKENPKLTQRAKNQAEQFTRAIKYRLLIRRNRLTSTIISAIFIIACCVCFWWYSTGQYQQSTEDAYVEGNVVLVTAQLSGTITAINADTTDMVKEGQALVELNPIDTHLALEKAKANLAQTVRSVRTQFASKDQWQANLAQKQTELSDAQAQYARRQVLAQTGALSTEEIQTASQKVKSAQAALEVARKQLTGGQAMIDNTSINTHPSVLNAEASLKEAYINTQRTSLPAPTSGMVTKRSAQIGQHVSVGTTLMSIVPLDHVWVNANFKESQLKNLRVGQSVILTADMYGRKIKYNGTILGLDAGTGSAFSLLPAQNATGNWIKIVQRVPVRIALAPDEIAKNPLRIGLSMKVSVDTRIIEGTKPLTASVQENQSYQTNVFKNDLDEADKIISEIIRQNMGKK